MKVLVVDDSLIVRKVVSRFLDEIGYTCLSAASGGEALDMIRNETMKFMVLDLHMEGMTGFELMEAILEEGLDIPVIVLTADLQDQSKEKAGELGAKAYLQKPFNKTEFQTVIEHVAKL